MTDCEHCWHSFTSPVARNGVNLHGAFCITHPDLKRPHEHTILVHKKKCCHCGKVKSGYDEFIDTGEKEAKPK